MISAKRPLYIAFEGIEGSGKSSQAARLANAMSAVLTRENGGTVIGQAIRDITHSMGLAVPMDPWCEALLFAADRAQHITEVVKPAILGGRHVVSDRSLYSSIAYQGFGRGVDVAHLFSTNAHAVHDRFPDIVIQLAINYTTMQERMRGRQLDRIESEGKDFFERVMHGFEDMRIWAPCDLWAVIDGSRPVDEVTANIVEVVETFIKDWA